MARRLPPAAWGSRGALSTRQPAPASPIPRGGPRAAGRSRPSPLWPGVLTSGGLQATWAVTRRGGGVDEQLLEQRPKSEGGGEASPGPTHCPGQQRTGPKLIRVAGRLGGRSWPAWWLHGGGQWARGSPLRSTFTGEVGSTQDTETPGVEGCACPRGPRPLPAARRSPTLPAGTRGQETLRDAPRGASETRSPRARPARTRSRPRPALLGRVCFINTGY